MSGPRSMPRVVVRFDGEFRLLGDEIPEALSYETIQQAVQDVVGHSGVVVIDVTEWEEATDG